MTVDHDRCECVNVCSDIGSPKFFPDKVQRAIQHLCVYVSFSVIKKSVDPFWQIMLASGYIIFLHHMLSSSVVLCNIVSVINSGVINYIHVSTVQCANVLCFSAMIRPENPLMKKTVADYGEYVAQCMPKYVQHVQVTHGGELELLIHPDGLLPVLSFLKNHINAQFTSVSDICGMDVPTRQYRFEVQTLYCSLFFSCSA